MNNNRANTSSSFRIQAALAAVSICFFLLVYLFLIIFVIGFTVLCVYGGFLLMVYYPRFLSIIIGIGIALMGIVVFIFLFKYIFKPIQKFNSNLNEISRHDEPELFKSIDAVAKAIGTKRPKKVFLSHEVNASVYYHSNFWSLFSLSRKNLIIGLGLVNTLTVSEFESILAHEFGHFSQKTMRLGSFVHHANQIILKTISDDEPFESVVESLSTISFFIAFFITIAIKLIRGMKWTLTKLYELINKNYLSLSREMEFHADEVAASIMGTDTLISALLRLSLSSISFDEVLQFYEYRSTENLKSENIYKEQVFTMNLKAENANIRIENGYPKITMNEFKRFNKSKLNIEDQWSSHPTTAQRIERLLTLQYPSSEVNNLAANQLFSNIEEVQQQMTNQLFNPYLNPDEAKENSFEAFQSEFQKVFDENSFAHFFNGYYDYKITERIDFKDTKNIPSEETSLESLFSNEKISLINTSSALVNDIELIMQISNQTIKVKTFDYDGIKHRFTETSILLTQLNKELEFLNNQIKANDLNIYHFFQTLENKKGTIKKLQDLYTDYFDYHESYKVKYGVYLELLEKLQFTSESLPFEEIKSNFKQVAKLEKQLKANIEWILKSDLFTEQLTDEIVDHFNNYLSKEWMYFGVSVYNNDNLNILYTSINTYASLLDQGAFSIKKRLLDYKESLVN